MYTRGLGQSTFEQIVAAIPQVAQSAAQTVQAFRPVPAGVTPNLPRYIPAPQGAFGLGIDPMTLALIAGGTILVILLMRK
ncbi:MAG: hypothetical protein ACREUY_01135 [Burkholderiales bacterium]